MQYLPPQNNDAEQSVLGSVIIDGESIKQAVQILSPDDFYREAHRLIFVEMLGLYRKKIPVDIVTLAEALIISKTLEKVGGATYISSLASMVPTSANIKYHANIIKQKSQKRQMINICRNTIDELYQEDEIADILSRHRQKVITAMTDTGSNITSIVDIAQEVVTFVEHRHSKKHEISGISSGLVAVDEITDGFQKGDLIVVGGRPGMGKSLFAMSILQNSCVPCGVVSLEMSSHQIGIRTLASLSGVELWQLRKGIIKKEQWPSIIRAGSRMSTLPIYFSFSARRHNEIERAITEMIDRHNIEAVMVDYLQLIRFDNKKQNREREIADISGMLKGIAVDYNIPVLAISQLNRELERREDKRPILADLRESGAIEQDADMVIFLYRDDYYNPNSEQKGIAEVIIAKGRNTGTGRVKVAFNGDKMQFNNL